MYFQIEELVLWPRNQAFVPRRLSFKVGQVNVISGISRTGKSAIIPIIDYCLGAKTCSIPTETIRKACGWFGVVVTDGKISRLFARREPGLQKATDEMMIVEGTNIVLPDKPEKNTSADGVRRMLSDVAGLSYLELDEDGGGFYGRVSFRDLAAFNFQPQNVIANPEVLFFKTDNYEHREKLRNIFPYVLGAITPEILAKQHELRRLQQLLKRLLRELGEASEVSARWRADLQARVTEGRELGLIAGGGDSGLANDSDLIAQLERVVRNGVGGIAISSSSLDEVSREASSLEKEEGDVSTRLSVLRQRLIEMDRVRESASAYAGALKIQRSRLKLADWLVGHTPDGCPVCGGEQRPAVETLAGLKKSLSAVEESVSNFGELPASFDRELQRIRSEATEKGEQLQAVRIRRDALARRYESARADQYRATQAARFIGNVEHVLEIFRRLGEDSNLVREAADLELRIAELRKAVREDEIARRLKRALDVVGSRASRIVPHLDAERPDAPIRLDVDDLTVKIIGTEREDALSEVGSGSNWLSYHVAIVLALHEYFLTLTHSPVPSFIVIDQPSQVYFPRKLAVRDFEVPQEPELESDEDIEAVRRIFGAIGQVVEATRGKLQVIVLDHAPQTVWGGQRGLYQAAEWRDGQEKLVPIEWIE